MAAIGRIRSCECTSNFKARQDTELYGYISTVVSLYHVSPTVVHTKMVTVMVVRPDDLFLPRLPR